MAFESELRHALAWCDAADEIALTHFRSGVVASLKADGSDVTDADRAIESMLRLSITAAYPTDAILGEEEGASGGGERRWILDPIDATTNFVRGIPVFATLCALEDADGLALGVVSAPALGTRWWATRGGGAFRDGSSIHVSSVASIEESHIGSGDVSKFSPEYRPGVLRLLDDAARHRGFGDFWGHMLVAQGSLDAMIDPIVSIWDVAACAIIVREAGGTFTTLSGDQRCDGGNALSSNALVGPALRAKIA